MVSTRTGKPAKMGKHCPVREKSGNCAKTEKVREFYLKYWENLEKLYWKIKKKILELREICQPVIVKTLQIW